MNHYTFSKLKSGSRIKIIRCSDEGCEDRDICIGSVREIFAVVYDNYEYGEREDLVRFEKESKCFRYKCYSYINEFELAKE